jgi:hypothetical protein
MALLLVLLSTVGDVQAQSTAFTYQGRLSDAGSPANGNYDLQFMLFDTAAVGTGVQQGITVTKNPVAATAGVFSVELDFGASPFSGPDRFLEIGVRSAGSGSAYTAVAPRVKIASAPYAINASTLGGLPAGRYVASNSNGNFAMGTAATPLTRLALGLGPFWTTEGWSGALSLINASAIGWEANASGQRFGIGQSTGGLYFFRTNSGFANTANPPVYELAISDTGNVGIGLPNPTKGKLQIQHDLNNYFASVGPGYAYDKFGPSSMVAADLVGVSLYASGQVVANKYIAFSDARIKRIEGRSDAARDLATLARIEVTDYSYIDTVEHGPDKYKKVIAQQVEKVYPQAVRLGTDVVPDIFRKASVRNGWISLATNLKKGERVRLISSKKEGVHEVLETAPGRFRTDLVPDGNEVFVYGREVNDFRSVDYEAIAMLNVSATQELNRRLERQANELSAQAAEIAALKQQLTRLARLQPPL